MILGTHWACVEDDGPSYARLRRNVGLIPSFTGICGEIIITIIIVKILIIMQ